MRRGLVPNSPARRWHPAALCTAIFCFATAATFAHRWDSKAGTGSTDNAMTVMQHGDVKQRVQAMVHASDNAAEIIDMLKGLSFSGSDRERTEAKLALQRLRKRIGD